MNAVKNLVVTLIFCAIIVASMLSTVLIYQNVSANSSAAANSHDTWFASGHFIPGNQQMMYVTKAKMV